MQNNQKKMSRINLKIFQIILIILLFTTSINALQFKASIKGNTDCLFKYNDTEEEYTIHSSKKITDVFKDNLKISCDDDVKITIKIYRNETKENNLTKMSRIYFEEYNDVKSVEYKKKSSVNKEYTLELYFKDKFISKNKCTIYDGIERNNIELNSDIKRKDLNYKLNISKKISIKCVKPISNINLFIDDRYYNINYYHNTYNNTKIINLDIEKIKNTSQNKKNNNIITTDTIKHNKTKTNNIKDSKKENENTLLIDDNYNDSNKKYNNTAYNQYSYLEPKPKTLEAFIVYLFVSIGMTIFLIFIIYSTYENNKHRFR